MKTWLQLICWPLLDTKNTDYLQDKRIVGTSHELEMEPSLDSTYYDVAAKGVALKLSLRGNVGRIEAEKNIVDKQQALKIYLENKNLYAQ